MSGTCSRTRSTTEEQFLTDDDNETTGKRPEASDSVIAEVRRAKAELMKRYNYDLAAMFRDARTRQWQSGHKVVIKSNGD